MEKSIENIETIESYDEMEMNLFIAEIRTFMENVYSDMAKSLNMRAKRYRVNEKDAIAFLRSKERMDNLNLILQYLIFYNRKGNLLADDPDERIKPFEQFKDALRFLYNQMLELDVKKAIFGEYVNILPIEEHSMELFDEKINVAHDTLIELCTCAFRPDKEGFEKVFDSLLKFSHYWFELRNHDLARIRKSDVYAFKLAKRLKDKGY